MSQYLDKITRAVDFCNSTIDRLNFDDFESCIKNKDILSLLIIHGVESGLYCKLFQHNLQLSTVNFLYYGDKSVSSIEFLHHAMDIRVFQSILNNNIYLLKHDLRVTHKHIFDSIISGNSFSAFDLYRWSRYDKYIRYFNYDDFNKLIDIEEYNREYEDLIKYASKHTSSDLIKSFPTINWSDKQLYKRGLIDAYYIEEKALTEHNSKSYYKFWYRNNICTWKAGQNAKYYRGDYLKALMTFLLCAHRHHITVEISHAIIELAISNVNTLK